MENKKQNRGKELQNRLKKTREEYIEYVQRREPSEFWLTSIRKKDAIAILDEYEFIEWDRECTAWESWYITGLKDCIKIMSGGMIE